MSPSDQEMASPTPSVDDLDSTDTSNWVLTPPRPEDDEITPFSSPQLGALSCTSRRVRLHRRCSGELTRPVCAAPVNTDEDPIDEFKLVSVDEKLEAVRIKGEANVAFIGQSKNAPCEVQSEFNC